MQGEFLLKFGRYVLQLAVGPHDVADRLNYQHSVLLLLLVAGIVALKLFVFKPIQASASSASFVYNFIEQQHTQVQPLFDLAVCEDREDNKTN